MNLFLLSSLACLGGFIATVVDGRHAVTVAAVAAALALAPTAAVISGDRATVALLGAAAAATVAGRLATVLGHRLPWIAGLDPLVPLYSPGDQLFGQRSTRVAGAAVVLPLASWVSLNIPVGGASTVAGLLFPAAYVGLCTVVRLICARTLEDLAVALVLISYAAATGWLITDGAPGFGDAVLALVPVPIAGLAAGWMAGRHRRRVATAL